MFISKRKYNKKIDSALDKGFNIGKLHTAAKIYKEIMEGTTLYNISNICQNILHKGDTEF